MTSKLDFIHLQDIKKQGKLRHLSARRTPDAHPAQKLLYTDFDV
jgi:hypothetical protein